MSLEAENLTRVSVQALDNILGFPIPVLNHGFIRVIDYMGDDAAIVQAARVSYGAGTKTPSDDATLINYLMRHWHTTPFEMCEIKLHVKLPIFVARQWIRHRTASVNEYSARYSELDREFYIPEPDHLMYQSKDNKQGRSGPLQEPDLTHALDIITENTRETYGDYEMLIREGEFTDEDGFKLEGLGVARELGRMVLPSNVYTQWYWKTNLKNLLNFLRLRADSHAQYEIRVYAEIIETIVSQWVPLTFAAYQQYQKNSITFSEREAKTLALVMKHPNVAEIIEVIKQAGEEAGVNKREFAEFMAKIERIKAYDAPV